MCIVLNVLYPLRDWIWLDWIGSEGQLSNECKNENIYEQILRQQANMMGQYRGKVVTLYTKVPAMGAASVLTG